MKNRFPAAHFEDDIQRLNAGCPSPTFELFTSASSYFRQDQWEPGQHRSRNRLIFRQLLKTP